MNISADLVAPCSPDELYGWVDDLSRYPQWMGLVHRADRLNDDQVGRPVWNVELRAHIGPFSRSKRLTMTRTVGASDGDSIGQEQSTAVFERTETDGRRHSVWRLSVTVVPADAGSRLDMNLHYGGALWTGGVVERALNDEIAASRQRLLNLIGETRR